MKMSDDDVTDVAINGDNWPVSRKLLMWAGSAMGVTYLTMVFVAGLLVGNAAAWRLSIASAGLSYFCTAANAWNIGKDHVNVALVLYLFALILGSAAGASLL